MLISGLGLMLCLAAPIIPNVTYLAIRTVTTCSMRCTSILATRRCNACYPSSSITVLLWLKCQVAHREITDSGECKKRTRPRAGRLRESLPIRVSLPCVLQPSHPGEPSRATFGGSSQPGAGPLRHRGRAIVLRTLSTSAPPHILHQRAQAFMRGGDAAES